MSRNEGDQRGGPGLLGSGPLGPGPLGPGPLGPGPQGPASGPMPVPHRDHRGVSPMSRNQEPDQRGGPGGPAGPVGPAGPGPMQKQSSSMLPHRGDHQRGDSPMSRLDDLRSGGPPGGPRGPMGGPGGPIQPSKMMHNSRDPRGDSPLSRGLEVLGGRSGPPTGPGGPPGGSGGVPGGLLRRGVSPISRDERGFGRGSPDQQQPQKRGQSPMMSFGERGRSGSPALTPTGSSLLSRPPSTTLPSVDSKKDFVKEWNKGNFFLIFEKLNHFSLKK